MFGSDVLDVAIALSFVYLLLSLLATTVGELIARALALRSATLVDAIRNVLANTDGQLLVGFWNQPLVRTLSLKNKATPPLVDGSDKPVGIPPKSLGQGRGVTSYMSSRVFAVALLDTVSEQTKHKTGKAQFETSDDVRLGFEALTDPEVRRLFLAIVGIDSKPLEQTQKDLAKWFDEYMERVGGWYKRKAQVIALVLGLTLAALLNVDSLTIANTLLVNPTLRDSVVKMATEYVQQPPTTDNSDIGATVSVTDTQYLAEKVTQIASLQNKLASLNLPILWVPADSKIVDPREVPMLNDWTGWFYKILGLLVTGLLVSLGAPFWFDLLMNFTNVRSAGKVPQKVEEPPKAKDSSSGSGEKPSRDNVIIPVVERPSPPSVDLDSLADTAVQLVEGLKSSGRLRSRAEEDDAAVRYLTSEAARRGLDATEMELYAAWLAAYERRSNT